MVFLLSSFSPLEPQTIHGSVPLILSKILTGPFAFLFFLSNVQVTSWSCVMNPETDSATCYATIPRSKLEDRNRGSG